MSEVEQFYKAVQEKLGGNVPWERLPPSWQEEFTHACSVIAQIAETVVE